MVNITEAVKRNAHIVTLLLPVLSFIPALLILYYLHAWTFEQTYRGRTFLLIFLWLAVLELILGWENIQKNKVNKLRSMRTVLFVIALLLPTLYVVVANYYGINTMISDLAGQYISPTYKLVFQSGVAQTQEVIAASQVPISFEFLLFATFLCFIILIEYGINSLADFSLAITFAGIFGLLFTIDELYPGNFTPLLVFVPMTATLAAKILTLMGYHTSLYFGTSMASMPLLIATNRYGSFAANIDWTCAGVESLLIYTVMILLLFRKTVIRWRYRIIYFVIGAAVTYFINSLRIAYLFILGIEYGNNSPIWQNFHNDYAMLISIGWIVSYLLIIIGSQALWGKIKNRKTGTKKAVNFQTQIELSE